MTHKTADKQHHHKAEKHEEKQHEDEPRIKTSSTGPYLDELTEEEQKQYRILMGWPPK